MIFQERMFTLRCSNCNNQINKLEKLTATMTQKDMWNFTAVFQTIRRQKTITTIQVVVNEKRHGLSMLVDKNLHWVIIVISFLGGIERYIQWLPVHSQKCWAVAGNV